MFMSESFFRHYKQCEAPIMMLQNIPHKSMVLVPLILNYPWHMLVNCIRYAQCTQHVTRDMYTLCCRCSLTICLQRQFLGYLFDYPETKQPCFLGWPSDPLPTHKFESSRGYCRCHNICSVKGLFGRTLTKEWATTWLVCILCSWEQQPYSCNSCLSRWLDRVFGADSMDPDISLSHVVWPGENLQLSRANTSEKEEKDQSIDRMPRWGVPQKKHSWHLYHWTICGNTKAHKTQANNNSLKVQHLKIHMLKGIDPTKQTGLGGFCENWKETPPTFQLLPRNCHKRPSKLAH